MFQQMTRGCGILICVLAVGGCADRDPYLRTDVWKPTGANAANIAAMAANPHDLISGRRVIRTDSRGPELAVEHVWSDQGKASGGAAAAAGGAGSGASGGSSSSGSPGS